MRAPCPPGANRAVRFPHARGIVVFPGLMRNIMWSNGGGEGRSLLLAGLGIARGPLPLPRADRSQCPVPQHRARCARVHAPCRAAAARCPPVPYMRLHNSCCTCASAAQRRAPGRTLPRRTGQPPLTVWTSCTTASAAPPPPPLALSLQRLTGGTLMCLKPCWLRASTGCVLGAELDAVWCLAARTHLTTMPCTPAAACLAGWADAGRARACCDHRRAGGERGVARRRA